MIIYLDLDRTVFRTARANEIWQQIGLLYPGIDAHVEYERRSEFYHYIGDGESYFHDMSAQLKSIGLDPEAVYAQLVNSELADGRFEYDGCAELLAALSRKYEVKILTFGKEDYQVFKAALCPSLRGIHVVTTLRSKADVLEEMQGECWLVDDKPIGDELPGNVSFVQVDLENKYSSSEVWPLYRSLPEVKKFFEEVLA